MSEAFDFQAIVPLDPNAQARDALYDIRIIADILQVLASADISGNAPLCGTSIEYLADRLVEAVDRVQEGGRL